MTSQSIPDIFAYHDYRKFLSDWVEHRRRVVPAYSLRQLSRDSGLSVAYLSLILANRRSLSNKSVFKLKKALSLSPSEQRYFGHLVQLSESSRQEDRVKAFQNLKRFDKYIESHQSEYEVYRYMSKWYYVAMRELAGRSDFSDDSKWIQDQLIKPVSATEVQEALSFLFEHGFLMRDKKGKIRQTDRNVDCISGIYNLSLNQFHKQILALTGDAIDQIEKDQRYLSGYTFLLNRESYQQMISILDEAREKIRALESQEAAKPGEKIVYHTEFLAIPLSGRKK